MAVFTPFLPRDTPFKFITVCGVDYNLSSLNAVEQTGEPLPQWIVDMVCLFGMPCSTYRDTHLTGRTERRTNQQITERRKERRICIKKKSIT